MKKIVFFLLISFSVTAQFQKTDSLGNFYVIEHTLVWQKTYPLHDIDKLNEQLSRNPFTQGINLNGGETSKILLNYRLQGNNLPQFTQHDYNAFLVIDVFYDRYRVSVKQIRFPDFKETYVSYNGMRTSGTRGTLEHYILSGDSIKRTTGAKNTLYAFDEAFSQVFDPMTETQSE